jgi:hypothetical protein
MVKKVKVEEPVDESMLVWKDKGTPKVDSSKLLIGHNALLGALKDENALDLVKKVNIGFTANQYIIRFPREITEAAGLGGCKKPQFVFKLKSDEIKKKDNIIRGEFEIIKNGTE